MKKRRFFSFLLVALAIVLVASALTPAEKKSKTPTAAPIPLFVGFNTQKDPDPSFIDCQNLEINMIILIDRSKRQTDLPPDIRQNYIDGVKMFLRQINLFVNGLGSGNKAHVIIGAYGTYNVWQNIPLGNNGKLVRNQAWRNSINIADTNNLNDQLEVIDNIYFNDGSSDTYDMSKPNTAYKGYTGLEPARAGETDFMQANLDDALVQSAREISRWTNEDASLRGNDDFDFVMALTSGYPNVNDGEKSFPSRTNIEEPYKILGIPMGPFADVANNDLFYTQETVTRLRNGNALPNYVDPSENGSLLRDSDKEFDGARPPVRVFGQAVINTFTAADAWVMYLTQIFGIPAADYDSDPNTGQGFLLGNFFGQNIFALPGSEHAHWDKTLFNISSSELSRDLLTAFDNHPCVPTTKQPLTPELQLSILGGGGSIAEGGSETVTINVTVPNDPANPSRSLSFDFDSLEIVVGDGTTTPREECIVGGHSCLGIPNNKIVINAYNGSSATIVSVTSGNTVYTSSTGFPPTLLPGDVVSATWTITNPIGMSYTNNIIDFRVDAMARALYSELLFTAPLLGWTYAAPATTTFIPGLYTYPA